MSTSFVEAVEVDHVRPHNNADRLEVAVVKGAPVVVSKGMFSKGEKAAYFPPNTLIPDSLANKLGVTKYLKHSVYNEGEGASQCRVAGCRLRGEPSFGFLAKLDQILSDEAARLCDIGLDLSEACGAKKYVPPVRMTGSGLDSEYPLFHRYTDIENYQRYPTAIPQGTPVRITEKIHGTNSRVGIVKVDGEWQEMAGSHRVRRRRPEPGTNCMYWEPLTREPVRALLEASKGVAHSAVIIFGEIYGPGVQDMDYGVPNGQRGFRVFDISVDGQYVGWSQLRDTCAFYGVETVPLLYEGPFEAAAVATCTYGRTTIGEPRCAFKEREGVVITPLEEQPSAILGGRMILKSVSADYLDRKGAEDNE